MVSYVPKANRSVILLSSEHRDAAISKKEQKKPEIISHYNAIKGAVDTLDKIVAECSCNKQSRRFPVVLFMNLIDIAAVNAFILWTNLHPEWNFQYLERRRLGWVWFKCRVEEVVENTNCNVTPSNWLSFLEVVQQLKHLGLTYVGTLKKFKREIPPQFVPRKSRKVGKDETLFGYTKNVLNPSLKII
ncbi:hypothetical protein ILUMI_01963 [Ignelater luminosus]|uniref:PiggyBac transposable element-derived protein domain-containing protein n=1 Tax=Ignelater luminosus TaxID=2038154 RepID=A0A8K0GGX5_IGNLU|nr:hypothetical protein ILUMI_01963 [Ignelater luminosus]